MESAFTDELIKKARAYQITQKAADLLRDYHPLIIAGVTASGKNSLIDYIIERANYQHVVSHTTRSPRQGEENGIAYWFVDNRQMIELIDQKKFIEVQPIHGDTVYGTSFEAYEKVIANGKKPLMDLDIQGIIKLTEFVPHLEPIFLLPPSFEIWMERLGGRDFMSDGEKARRLRSARIEMEEVLANKNFILIVNHEVDETANEIMGGINSYSSIQQHNYDLGRELIEYLRDY